MDWPTNPPTQLQDEILKLRKTLHEKEQELAEVKHELGITPFTEFKQSVADGWKVVGNKWKEVKETETWVCVCVCVCVCGWGQTQCDAAWVYLYVSGGEELWVWGVSVLGEDGRL